MSRRGVEQNLSSDTSLTFGETRVTGSDIRILANDDWINVTLVAFYFEYLNSRVFTSYKCSLCVPPEITGLLQITPANEMGVFLEPLEIDQKDLILFSLHDSPEHDDNEHIHWSLLVYSKFDNSICHYDSLKDRNKSQAIKLGEKLKVYFKSHDEFKDMQCLQEKKPQDSALHVMANAEQIITFAAKNRTLVDYPNLIDKQINEFRQKMLKLIWKLKHSSSIYQIKSRTHEQSLFSKSFHEEHDRDRY